MVRRLVICGAAAAAVAVATALPAQGANTITGTLSKSGYTVVAVGTTGTSVSVKAKGKKFTLKAPSTSTLHLVAPNGRYAGPIVVATKGKNAVLGVKKGANLGKITIKSSFAKTKKALAKKYQMTSRTAPVDGTGAPIGAAGFGLIAGATPKVVQSKVLRVRPGAPDLAIAGQDADKDGLPNTIDIDANGNSVIDAVDPQAPKNSGLRSFVNYFANLDTTTNFDADPNSTALIDERMKSLLELVFLDIPDGAELNCLGLPWCSTGGTGEITPFGTPSAPGAKTVAFPACCLDAATGWGKIYKTSNSGTQNVEFRIWPRATSAAIKSGDTLIEMVPKGDGTWQEIPGTIGMVFNTVPAVKSWSDGIATTTISYPAAANAAGTQASPFPLPLGKNVTLTFWRPQRAAIESAGEPAGFMDIGGLNYDVQFMNMTPGKATSPGMPQCGVDSISTSDPSAKSITRGAAGAIVDLKADAAASPASTLSFTMDIAKCAAGRGMTLANGDTIQIGLEALSPAEGSNDHVVQNLYFKIVTPSG